tara:strand:+ start:120 stop:527 length:408 start_codon:yes stop_codon:yes gene_type:complete
MLTTVLNLFHFIFIFLPIIIYFIPIKYVKKYFKFLFLYFILTPIHWNFFDDRCIFTVITQKLGDMDDATTQSGFSEKYMKWLYKPIAYLFGWKWNSEGISKMVYLHWGINFVFIWYYLFYIYIDCQGPCLKHCYK